MTDPWQQNALRELAAAWPEGRWEIGDGAVRGRAEGLYASVERLPEDAGWLRAEVYRDVAELGDEVEGMDPRDPVRAVRSALRRLAAKAPTPRAVLVGGAA